MGAAVSLMLIGAVMILFPKAVYILTESWKNDLKQEPSDTYIRITRFGGGVFLLIGFYKLFV